MLWWLVWHNLSFTWCKSSTLQSAKTPLTITESPLCFTVIWYSVLLLFHQIFAARRPYYLSQRFWTLIRSSIGLSSVLARWPTAIFWHCFASSAVVSWQQYRPVSKSLFNVNVDFFLDIGSVVHLYLKQRAFCDEKLVSDEIFLYVVGWSFFLLFFFVFWLVGVMKYQTSSLFTTVCISKTCFWGFYGISNFVVYLMPVCIGKTFNTI